MELEKLLASFAEANIKAHEAIMAGDSKLTVKYSNQEIHYWKKIKLFGDEGKSELSKYFHYPHPSVRLATAVCLLKYKTNEAMAILRELSKGKGLGAFEAGQAIKRWEEGNWNLD